MSKYVAYTITALLLTVLVWSHQPVHAQEGLGPILDLIRQQIQESRPDLDSGGGSQGTGSDALFNQIEQGEETVNQFETGGVSLSVSPRFPEANQDVTFEISGVGVNLDEAFYTWNIDGLSVASGYGRTAVQHTLGDVGAATQVQVTINRAGQSDIERRLVVVPNSVDILWEAIDSHTPPFYRGKALPSYDSIIKLTAVSTLFDRNGDPIDPESVVYTWEKNGRARDMADYSGYGGNTAYMLGDFLNKAHRASVEITSENRGLRTSKNTALLLHEPDIVLYEKHPLSGIIYERALGEGVTANESVRVVAEPFYMDERNPFDIQFSWNVNNNTLSNQARMDQGELRLITDGDRAGRSTLRVEAKNPSKMLQSSEQTLRVNVE